MSDEAPDPRATSVLSTKVEEDFIAPLTAIRGSLEILRDFPDLDAAEHKKFVEGALAECRRIEKGVEDLAVAVYAAANHEASTTAGTEEGYAGRVTFLDSEGVAHLDFSALVFDTAATVNAVFDTIEQAVMPTGKRWYFLVNYTGCNVFPEAWVAFAHRGKEIRVMHGFGTIRYADGDDTLPTRADAMVQIAEARRLAKTAT